MRRVPGLLGLALVCTGPLGVADGQLVKKAPSPFFDRGEGGDGGSKPCTHSPGILDRFLPVRRRVGQLAFAIRGRPGDRRLVPVAMRVRALHGFLGALKAVGGGQQQCLRALDGLKGNPVCAGHQTAEFCDKPFNLFFTLVGHPLALVSEGLTLVGRMLALVSEGLTLVGHPLALVGHPLAPVGEGFAYVGRTLALVPALGWLRWCMAAAVHVLKNALVL